MRVLQMEQGSKEWLDARLGRVTGTRLCDVMGTPRAQKKLISTLVAEEGTESSKVVRPSAEMERGTAEEIFALKAFGEKYGKKIKKVGICISDEFDWLAHSPDGLIRNFVRPDTGVKLIGKYTEAIEVKNPDSATMISYRLGEGISDLGVPEDYKWQVVQAFLVNEDLERLHFVVYDARFIADDHKMHMVIVERDNPALQSSLKEARERLAEFRKEWLRCRDIVLPTEF